MRRPMPALGGLQLVEDLDRAKLFRLLQEFADALGKGAGVVDVLTETIAAADLGQLGLAGLAA